MITSLPSPVSSAHLDHDNDDDDDQTSAAGHALQFLERGHNEPVVAVSAHPPAPASAPAPAPAPSPPAVLATTAALTTNAMSDTTATIDTPPPKTTTTNTTFTITSPLQGSAKKVDFSPWPTYHHIPALGQFSSPAPLHATPPLNNSPIAHTALPRPLKSILKPSADRPPSDTNNLANAFNNQEPEDFRGLLHSALTQLEGASRDARRDAYLALNGSIKAYARVPDPQLLAEKMGRLTQCLSRDLAWKDAVGRLDAVIVQQALSLTCAILFDPQTQGLLDPDFQVFVVDRSIFVLEQPEMAKAVVKGHLHLLCVQRFPRSIFTAGRAERLITVLQGLEARNSMIAARLVIYQRLIERAPNAMLHKIKDWVEHVFHALLSTMGDIQRRAIDVCTQMGMSLGHHPQTAKAISELCEKEIEEGQSYGDYLNMQLMQMTSNREKAPLVPEIWVAVVLCFRTKRYPIGKWPKFRDWLLTIQKCLNSSDMAVKRPANNAWNRLVFAVMPDSSTSDPLRSMLKVPILAGLERRGNNELSQQLRQLSLESYCNLLHYAMRPELVHEELDLAWDMYVGPILTKLGKAGCKGRNTAFQILHGLLKKTGGTWNVNAAHEHEPIQPDDLPRLDVRWVRSRIARFMGVLEPMILAEMSTSADMQRAADHCWRSLMAAIAEAGCQEIKASNELKDAIALAISFFRRLWSSASRLTPEGDPVAWLTRYQNMLEVTVESLGPGHFVDDILTRDSNDTIKAAPTSTHRLSKPQATIYSPFILLFTLYYDPPHALQPQTIQSSAAWFLRLLAGAKVSTSALLGLLQRSLQVSADLGSCELEHIHGLLWSAVADTALHALSLQATISPQRDKFVMGVALKSTASIILEGLRYSDTDCCNMMVRLYNAACQSARHIAGSGGIVLAIMEPLARLVNEQIPNLSLVATMRLASTMAESGAWPSTRSELDQSRKALWTVSLEPHKMQVFDPFDHVYKFFCCTLRWAYDGLESIEANEVHLVPTLMSSLASFSQRCPSSLFQMAFHKLQHGYAIWAEDDRRLVFPVPDATCTAQIELGRSTIVQHAIDQLWSQIVLYVTEKLPSKDNQLLEAIEPFLVAGFTSPSRTIVNSAIEFWNSTFAQQPKLDYPPKLFPILRSRQVQTGLILPGFSDPIDTAQSQQLTMLDRRKLFSGSRVLTRSRERDSENISIKQHIAAQARASDGNGDVNTCGARSTSRPRVDDSQVEFARIEPEMGATIAESQALTEHQREVRDRQKTHAQAYPEFSSSPLIHDSIAHQHMAKELKFISDLRRTPDGDIVITMRDGRNDDLSSENVPSSPTPRATGRTGKAAISQEDQEEDDHKTASEPPSSPLAPVVDQGNAAQASALDLSAASKALGRKTRKLPPEIATRSLSSHDHVSADSDVPSDTQLPSAQIEHGQAIISRQGAEAETKDTPARLEHPETPSKDASAILPSTQSTATTPSEAGTNGSRTPRSSKKRKRTTEIVHAARKRKPQSPLKTFMSIFQNTQDNAIEEEIVVASRPPSSSSASVQEASSQVQGTPLVDETEAIQSSETQSPEPVLKRRRGRPRKSESHIISVSSTKGIKRSASALSVPDPDSPGMASTIGNGSISPRQKVRRVASDVAMAQNKQHMQCSKQANGVVMIPSSTYHALPPDTTGLETEDEVEDVTVIPEAGLDQVPGTPLQARTIAEPQSILGRLRGILAECKNMILGSHEEREFDDVLFEIRREVHEAGSCRRTG